MSSKNSSKKNAEPTDSSTTTARLQDEEKDTIGNVMVTFFTNTFDKYMPEQAYSVPLNVLPEGLSSLVQSVLNVPEQKFDFLYKDEFIGVSLMQFLRRRDISFEELFNIEYTPALQAKEGSLLPHDDWVSSVRAPYLNNAEILLTGAYDHCIRLWEGENCLALGTFHQECVKEVALSPLPVTSDIISRLPSSSTSFSRDANRRKRLRSSAAGESFMCVSCSKDGSIASWVFQPEVSALQLLGSITAHTDGVDSIHVSSDGGFVASASWDATVKLFQWNQLLDGDHPVHTKKAPLFTFTDHTRPVTCCRFSEAQGTAKLFSAGLDGNIACLDVETGTLQFKLMGDHPINGITVRPASSGGSDLVIAACTDNRARLYDTRESGKIIKTFSGHRQWLYAASWIWEKTEGESGGNLFATASEDACVRVFDLRSTAVPLLTLDTLHTDGVLDVTYVGNAHVASCGKDNKVKSFVVNKEF